MVQYLANCEKLKENIVLLSEKRELRFPQPKILSDEYFVLIEEYEQLMIKVCN